MELGELPEELIEEILRRQSFKDTLKSKCVCRRWETIIADPTFLQYRRQLRSQSSSNKRQSNPIRLLTCSGQCPVDKGFNITGKGLLCLSKSNSNGINRSAALENDSLRNLKLVLYNKKEISNHVDVTSSSFLELVLIFSRRVEPVHLHNPSTEEFFALPRNPDWDHCSLDTMGLGRVDSTNEYKVVRAFYNRHNKCSYFEVFTLGSDDHWRTVPCFHEIADEPSAFVDGGVYMFLEKPDHDKCLVRFDIEHEDWTVIPSPEGLFNSWISFHHFLSIREVNGLLCLTNNKNSAFGADIWLLKDYKQGIWVLNNTILFSYFLNFFDEELECPFIYPLSLDYGDGKLLLALFLEGAIETKLFSYDPRIQNVELLPLPHPDAYLTATLFTESFDSLF